MVDSLFDRESEKVPLEGGYFKKESWYYRKCGLVIGDTWVLFGISVKILELVWQVTWSKVIICKVRQNPYQEDGTTQESEEDLQAEYPYLFDHHRLNLEDEIHLKGG